MEVKVDGDLSLLINEWVTPLTRSHNRHIYGPIEKYLHIAGICFIR